MGRYAWLFSLSFFFCSAPLLSYQKPAQVTYQLWNTLQPYLIPKNHPITRSLDYIFASNDVLLYPEKCREAGFIFDDLQDKTCLIVARHQKVPGYIFKFYLHTQRYYKDVPEHCTWMDRVQGANKIRNLIKRYQWQHLFKVPKKWIYPLPDKPILPSIYLKKNFVLVEEDMDLLSEKQNKKRWSSKKVTPKLLKGLYTILSELGLKDCAKIDNIPFSKDGRVAFVDTQTFGEWPVPYKRLCSSLSESNCAYWQRLYKGL